MAAAIAYVARHPGTAIMPVGEHLGFTRNRGYGYDPVHRAISLGEIVHVPGLGRRGAYWLVTSDAYGSTNDRAAAAAVEAFARGCSA